MLNSDFEDEQWLKVLAGSALRAEPRLIREAQALRGALKVYQQQLDEQTPVADDQQLQQLLFRLRREGAGLRAGEDFEVASFSRTEPLFRDIDRPKEAGSVVEPRKQIARRNWTWGLAASLVLTVAVMAQWAGFLERESEPQYRGSTAHAVLTAKDPESAAAELLAKFRELDGDPQSTSLGYRRFQLQVRPNAAITAYLRTRQLEPVVQEGTITIVVEPPRTK